MTIANNIRTTTIQTENANKYFKLVKDRFHFEVKSLVGTLLAHLTIIKYNRLKSMQEHIIRNSDITTKLETLGITVDDSFLV